jgi:2-methylcitrate synthase
MDVMRTSVSALGTAVPEKDEHNVPGESDTRDKLIATLSSALLYWSVSSFNRKESNREQA